MHPLKYLCFIICLIAVGCSDDTGTKTGQGGGDPEEDRIQLTFKYAKVYYSDVGAEGQEETANYVLELSDVESNEYGMYLSKGNVLSMEIIMPKPNDPESLTEGDYVYRFPTERPYSIIASMYSYYGAVSAGNNVDKQYLVAGDATIKNSAGGISVSGEIRNTANRIVEFSYAGPVEFDTWVPYGYFKYGTAYYFGSYDYPDLANYLLRLTNMEIGDNLDIKGDGQAAYLFLQTSASDPKFYLGDKRYDVFGAENTFDNMLLGLQYTRVQTRNLRNKPTDYFITGGKAVISNLGSEHNIGMELVSEDSKQFNLSYSGELQFVDNFPSMTVEGFSPEEDYKYSRYFRISLESEDYDRNINKGDSISIVIGVSNGFNDKKAVPVICYFGAENYYDKINDVKEGNELLDDNLTRITTGNGTSFESRKITAGFVCFDYKPYGMEGSANSRCLLFLHGRLLDETGKYWDLAGVTRYP